MSGTLLNQATLATLQGAPHRGFLSYVRAIARFGTNIVLSPLRLFLSIRRSMTAASVSLLLIGIVSLNIVWGYPWTGMFSACASMMFVGWLISRMMRPSMEVNFSLPSSAPAGYPFSVVTHLKNRRRLPAMDLGVAFADVPSRRRDRKQSLASYRSLKPPQSLAVIHPAARVDLGGSLVFDRRGVHPLPDVVVTSMFPFHLFRSSRRYESAPTIAITPRLMTGDEDVVARGMLDTLGGWSHKLQSGDALDYTGSREYESGMSVRRWDFGSWARLGRPIVREFQSPSIQLVMLIVDTSSSDETATRGSQREQLLERVLSFAATVVTELGRKAVRVCLFVTSEQPAQMVAAAGSYSVSDSESLLIRLAAAEPSSPAESDRVAQQAMEQLVGSPVLVLTARRDHPLLQDPPPHVTVIRVDPAHEGPLSSPRKSRQSHASV